jgi:hypothetical protein
MFAPAELGPLHRDDIGWRHRAARPARAVYRFKKAGAPSGNSKLPTWTNVSPKLGDCSPHVWHEKNAKDANYGIERGRRQLQIKQVADAKFGVFEASIFSLGSRKSQQIICEVHQGQTLGGQPLLPLGSRTLPY